MYDLRNLNDYEFEHLSLDIMERKLNVKLYRFPKGRDGGIDLCDKIENPKIIIQVKHYKDYSGLKNTIKRQEADNVKKLKPENYYLCTSCQLTKNNKLEIYDMLKPYMKSAECIIDGIDINDFIEDEQNQDIVRKHYKLWLAASNVLSLINNKKVFIDCDELVYDVEKKSKFFVKTKGYIEALEKLEKENIIIIVGAPGVGKSTISKMILLKYVSDGYSVRYVSDNNIGDIKNILSEEKETKEIVLLDDFLGQHYLNLKESKPNELRSLCSFIKRNPNKKLIMNSRITIIKEARNKFINFNEFMEEYDENKYLIDLNDMSQIEKAQILYNHIYFNDLPEKYFADIKKDRRYLNIVKHRNYNPRIIEYVTKTNRIKELEIEDYYKYIMDNLDNPKDVWKDEFENRLEVSDRKLMFTLYSSTNTYIDIDRLNKAYINCIKKDTQIDKSINTFNRVVSRLSDSLVNKISKDGKIKIGVVNPSINDYMKNEIDCNISQIMDIVQNAVYIEQILKFEHHNEVKEYLYAQILSGNFLKYKALDKSIFFYYVKYVFKYNIKNKDIINNVKLSFEKSYENLKLLFEKREYSKLLSNIFLNQFELLKFYHIEEILFDSVKMEMLFQKMDYDIMKIYLKRIGQMYEDNTDYELDYENILDVIEEYLICEIEDTVGEIVENDLYNIADRVLDNAERQEIEDFKEGRGDSLIEKMNLEVHRKIIGVSNKLIDGISDNIIINKLDLYEIESNIEIEEYLKESIDYLDDIESVYTLNNKSHLNETQEVDAIFERNLEKR